MTDSKTAPRRLPSRRTALVGAGLLALGIAGGAGVARLERPSVTMAPAVPVAITALQDDGGIATVRGRVAEVYGPMFVLADGGGRVLVDGGRAVDGTGLVAAGQGVAVQGRFRHGIVRAAFLVSGGGKVTALHPFGPPHDGPGGRPDHAGPHADGPGAPDGPPPPPPPPSAAAPARR